jgi:hypothetical protein
LFLYCKNTFTLSESHLNVNNYPVSTLNTHIDSLLFLLIDHRPRAKLHPHDIRQPRELSPPDLEKAVADAAGSPDPKWRKDWRLLVLTLTGQRTGFTLPVELLDTPAGNLLSGGCCDR